MILSWKIFKFGFLLGASLLLAACAGSEATATSTSTLEPATPTITTTINWFPATNTRTPLPAQGSTPTPGLVPALGALLFRDNFTDASLWTATTSVSGNSIVSNNRLTLTLAEGTDLMTIASLRNQPQVSDFYVQVNAQLSLCRGGDQISLLFRVTSAADFYRYSVNCNGEVRLERVVSGKPFVIRDWAPSPDAPRGAPAEVQISVWASGRDLRFFLGDHFQFTVNDQFFSQGGLGLSIRSEAGNPMSIGFSDLSVHGVLAAEGTPALLSTPLGP